MITFEEAKRVALAKVGPGCGLVESATIEKPYGWYFLGQPLAFLESGNFRDMRIGSNGLIVERADGRVFEFGSAYPAERWIANYERGFRYQRYDLKVSEVRRFGMTLRLLGKLDMTYVVPEDDGGTVWVIPREYTPDQLQVMLRSLPCTFTNQAFWHRVDVFEEIDATGCCAYQLREHVREGKPSSE